MATAAPSAGPSRRLRLVPLLLLLAGSGALALGWSLHQQGWEETDNAQVEAEITEIASQIGRAHV